MMPARRLLVTGATGFAGAWVLRHWRGRHPDAEIWAMSDRPDPPSVPVEQYRRIDLRDAQAVLDFVSACRPTEVVHLAGLIGGASLTDHLSVNVVGTDNLYAALSDADAPAGLRVVQVGSAAIYGKVREEDLPISESQPLRPVGPYALSKAAQDHLAATAHLQYGLKVLRARVFNMLGPGQSDKLVPMTFLRQLSDCRSGRTDHVSVGNTAPRRDFVDVRDVAAALDVLLREGEPGEAYNVASGQDVSVQEILDILPGVTGIQAPVRQAAQRTRGIEVPCVRADVSKIAAATGWQAKIQLRQSLDEMWRSLAQ